MWKIIRNNLIVLFFTLLLCIAFYFYLIEFKKIMIEVYHQYVLHTINYEENIIKELNK